MLVKSIVLSICFQLLSENRCSAILVSDSYCIFHVFQVVFAFLTFSEPILEFYSIIHCDFTNWKITLQFTTNWIKVFLKENKDDKSRRKQQKLAKIITCGSSCPEPPSERVSFDANTLLSQSNFLSLRTSYPTGRFYKNGWLEKHNTCSTPESKKQIIDSCHRRLPCCRLNKVEKRLGQKLRQRYCKLWNRWR